MSWWPMSISWESQTVTAWHRNIRAAGPVGNESRQVAMMRADIELLWRWLDEDNG